MSPSFLSPDIDFFDYFYNNSAIFEASIDQKYEKSLLLAWYFLSAISRPEVGPSPLYMG